MLDQITKLHDSESLYNSLISILKKEISVYEDLYAISLEEREIVVKSSIQELYENNSRKETCILKAKMLEEIRLKIVEKINVYLELEPEDITLTNLMQEADSVQKEELRDCQSILKALLTKIHELNEGNKNLIDSSVAYVQKSISFISQLISPSPTYLQTGEMKMNTKNGTVVCRKG